MPRVCAGAGLHSPFSMQEVFQLLKMSNCFDSKRNDVTEKSGECLKRSASDSSSCGVQLTSARFRMFVTAALTTLVRDRAGFGPSVARCHSSSHAAAGCPSLLCVLHISGFKMHILFSLSKVEAYDRR